jgi:hypothetical protein
LIYIAGWGRSGSTLLAALLARRVGGSAVGELSRVWELYRRNWRCGCGEPLRECGFWSRVFQEVEIESIHDEIRVLQREWMKTRKLPRLAMRGVRRSPSLMRVRTSLGRLCSVVHELTDGRPIIDSSKSPLFGWLLEGVEAIDASFVHLVRDSRAVAFSWSRPRWDPSAPDGRWMRRYDHLRVAWEWNLRNGAALTLKTSSSCYARIRYEDLSRDPDPTVGRLVARLGFAASSSVDTQAELFRGHHMLGGNPIRFQGGAVEVRTDDAWRKGMGRRQRWLVGTLTAPLLLAFGYLFRKEVRPLSAGDRR